MERYHIKLGKSNAYHKSKRITHLLLAAQGAVPYFSHTGYLVILLEGNRLLEMFAKRHYFIA